MTPWSHLQELIQQSTIPQREIAERLGISEKHLIDVVKDNISISPQLALKLEYVFDVSTEDWLVRDGQYQAQKVKEHENETIREEASVYSFFSKHYKHLVQYWYVADTKKKRERVRELRRFLSVASLESAPQFWYKEQYFRKSETATLSQYALVLWLRLAERQTEKQKVQAFHKKNIKLLVDELHPLMSKTSVDMDQVTKLCNKYGIYFVFVPEHFDQLPVRWLARYYADHPLIVLGNKQNRIDSFWFNLLHELWHVSKHLGKREMYFDDEDGDGYSDERLQEEQEANTFAQNILIDPASYEIVTKKPQQYEILTCAKTNKIHPWVVAARLAMDGYLSWQEANKNFRSKLMTDE